MCLAWVTTELLFTLQQQSQQDGIITCVTCPQRQFSHHSGCRHTGPTHYASWSNCQKILTFYTRMSVSKYKACFVRNKKKDSNKMCSHRTISQTNLSHVAALRQFIASLIYNVITVTHATAGLHHFSSDNNIIIIILISSIDKTQRFCLPVC